MSNSEAKLASPKQPNEETAADAQAKTLQEVKSVKFDEAKKEEPASDEVAAKEESKKEEAVKITS